MRRFLPLGLIFLLILTLVGCSSSRTPARNTDLTREMWMREININTNSWASGADSWFMTGSPNKTELMARSAPINAAISTMNVHVSQFSNIKVNGNFEVQLVGTNGPNTVYIFGPNDSVRDIVVRVGGDTLYLGQVKHPRQTYRVIVRVAVNQLNTLVQMGSGTIEGVGLQGGELNIVTLGRGNIYIGGSVNLRHVLHKGGGSINVFGAKSNCLEIITASGGCVNVSGDVMVKSIVHRGSANINIVGAHSPDLKVKADGIGKIGLYGADIHLHRIITRDSVSFYAFNVNSSCLNATAYGNSRIGLAGFVKKLFVDTYSTAQFQGRSLCAMDAYVRAYDWSHVNVSACKKIFVSATHTASVYYFGPSNILTQFASNNASVIPIFGQGIGVCALPTKTPYLKNYVAPRPAYTPAPVEPRNYSYSKPINESVVTVPRKKAFVPHETIEVPFSATTRTASKAPGNKLVGQG